ncbi:MAG TPA: glycosyltransferase family 4 protein [Planctomycetota bacterium]|nr:glycosyltransferase family 4 protein [Planctomycetota bacterium]
MRIAVLTDSLADTDGVGRYTIRLFRAMQALRKDLEVEVVLARKHPGLSAEVPAAWPIRIGLPPDYFFHVSPARFHAYAFWSLARIAPVARRADLVHAVKDYPHSWIGLRAAERARRPCVMTAHGTYSVVPLSDPRHGERARRAYPRFERILCVSRHTRQLIEERMPLSNLEVVPNAVDAGHYAERPRLRDRAWTGQRYVLGIGSLKERKGQHLAVAAFLRVAAEFPDVKHFVVGAYDGGDPYFRSIVAAVDAAGASGRVVFLGNVTEEEKIDLLLGAEAFVHTPVLAADGGFEGFGIVYLEAAASGVASIGTLGSGAEDAIAEGVSGRLVPPRPDAIAEALRPLLADRAMRERLRASSIEYARGVSWDRNAEKVLGIYDEILGRRDR